SGAGGRKGAPPPGPGGRRDGAPGRRRAANRPPRAPPRRAPAPPGRPPPHVQRDQCWLGCGHRVHTPEPKAGWAGQARRPGHPLVAAPAPPARTRPVHLHPVPLGQRGPPPGDPPLVGRRQGCAPALATSLMISRSRRGQRPRAPIEDALDSLSRRPASPLLAGRHEGGVVEYGGEGGFGGAEEGGVVAEEGGDDGEAFGGG